MTQNLEEHLFDNIKNPATGKPVKVGKSVSFSNKVYDDVTPLDSRIKTQNTYLGRSFNTLPINQKALYDIDTVPVYLKDDYNEAYNQTDNWYTNLNVASPDEIEEWKSKGKMGLGETAQRLLSLKSAKYVPFIGTTADVGVNVDMWSAVNRLKQGKEISNTEKELLVDYLREIKELQVRGTTMPSKALTAIMDSLPFMLEFGIGTAAALGSGGGGLAISGQALSKLASKKAARKALEKALKTAATESVVTGTKKTIGLNSAKAIYKSTYDDMMKAGVNKAIKEVGVKEAAKTIAKSTPENIVKSNFGSVPLSYMTMKNTLGGVADRQLSGSMYVTDAGEAVFSKPENIALSIMKAFGSSLFDNYTETMGWIFSPIGDISKYFAKPLQNILPKKFFTQFEKLVSSQFGTKASEVLKKYGYDGVIEEMGEELLNRFLCDVFGINGLEGYTIDGFLNNVFYANDPEQWISEFLSFAIMGAGAHGVNGITKNAQELLKKQGYEKQAKLLADRMNKRLYSPNEFYLDQGLIKIPGSQSLAEQELRKQLKNMGKDDFEINQMLHYATELQMREMLKDISKTNGTPDEITKKVDKLKDNFYNQLKNAGMDDAESLSNADISADVIAKTAQDFGIDVDELNRQFGIDIQNMTDEEAYEQYQNDNVMTLQGRVEQNAYADSDEYWLDKAEEYEGVNEEDDLLFQNVNSAGADANNIADAKREWEEKGTESKYFKNWFGDSKVVDSEGKPLVVYHGTLEHNIDEFDLSYARNEDAFFFTDNKNIATDYAKEYEETNDNISGKVYPVYLSMKNPYVVDAQGKTYSEYYSQLQNDFSGLAEQGYDGLIIKNIKDNKWNNTKPELSTVYAVLKPEQIKSVDNRGTFDSNSGNIYFQAAAMHKDNQYNSLSEFVKAVQNDIKTHKNEKRQIGNYKLSVPADVIQHDKKHNLSPDEWEEIENNITNIFIAKKTEDANSFSTNNYKVGIQTDSGNYYALTIGINNFDNLICTAMKNTKNGVEAFVEERGKKDKKKNPSMMPSSQPTAPISNNTNSVASHSQGSNNIIPQILEKITSNQANVKEHEDKNIKFQSMTKEELLSTYLNQEFGMNTQEITDMVKEDVLRIMDESGVNTDEFNFEDIRVYGSYSKGTNKKGSDLDIIVQYSGNMSEDSAFNILHSEDLALYDRQGNKVKIDINPINKADHGTIDDYSRILFQSAYHGTPHRFDNFSTDNIGTGEGAQAHGWGLYFAGDKNVSEKYRRKLSGNKVFYNGEELAQSYFYTHQWMQGKDVEENKYLSNLRSVIDDIGEIQASKKISLEEARQEFIKEYQSKKKLLAYQKKYLEIAKDIDTSKIDIQKGQLFEVDIPDSDVLLDEDKPFSEQPEKVQGAIAKLFNDLWNIDIYNSDKISSDFRKPYNELTGGQLYREIDNVPEMASKTLNKYGIKGITYDGIQDGRCYVIFDDKAVNVLKTYYQESEEGNTEPNSTQEGIANARGFTYETELADSVKNMIVLLKNKKDKSTYIHEFAHVYLNVLNRLAKTNSKAQDRLNTINKWLRYDGRGEYTTAQHEKFANGFVAYIKQGKAPTYGLKRAFEHFKKWLNDIYVALDNHSEFIMDSEAKAVFDEILGGTEHDKQLQKGIELYNRAISYAEIKKAEKNEKEIKQSQLSEYQRRYMNTAYDIIYYALQNNPEGKQLVKNRNQLIMILGTAKRKTGFKKKRKGIVSQFEQVVNILQSLSDEFSSRDGFLPEWGEFFKPLSDEYTDSELALDALDTIVQERYLTKAFNDDFDDSRYGYFSDATVEETQNIFDYIVEEYRDAKDKTIPLLAWNEFHSHIHPYIIDDFEKKWESETAEIDRYQSLSKMQQAKEDLKLYAAALKGQGDYHKQFVEYATKILDKLDFMTTADKEKIIKKLGEFGTFRDIERNLDDVMDYAETLQAVTERRIIADSIQREVKQTIHEWKNGIKKTKYTYPANKLFERLRELNRMTQEQVQDIYDEFVNEESAPDYVSDDVNNEDYYKVIEKMFVQFKANGMYYNSTAFLQDLLDKIQSAKFTAKVARDEIDFERRMQQIHYVDKCAQALNNRKVEIKENDKIKFLSNLNAVGFNFNGALRMIFNDNIKNWASLDYLYAKKDGQVGKDRREFLEKAKSIFGLEGKKGDIQLQSKFIDMTKKEFTITQRHSPDIEKGSYRVTEKNKKTGYNPTVQTQQVRLNDMLTDEWKPIEVELSRMEVLYYYIQAKNPTSYAILTDEEKGQFKKGDFENLLEELTPEEKLLGDLMQLSAEKYWEALNNYHIKKYHTELGKVKNYFPRLSESQEVNMLEMFNDFTQYSGTGKFQKQRTAGPGTRIASANALAVLFDHMERANTIVIMGEHLDLINKVFKNPDLKRLLENTWGEKVSQEFYGQLTGNLFTGQSAVKSLQEKWYQKVVGNLVKTALFLKPQIGIKQLISFMNYGKGDEYVSASEWMKAFTKQTFTPSEWKKNIEFMMANEYMADRFARGGSMDALKKELENKFFAKTSLLDEFWGMPIALGDIGAIILGGKPYIDVLMNKGYSKEEAFKIFIETTVNDQQSSIPSTLSNAQRNASKQPFSKMFFAYQNTPWQYYRQCTSAIMNAVQSGKTKDIKRASKMVLLYGWIFPAIFNMASSLSPLALVAGGDDDDLLNDINPLRTLTSLLTQHPIVGDWINGILNAIDDKGFYSNDLLTKHVKSVNKLIRDTKKGELTLKDIWDATCAFVEPSTGLPVGSAGNAVSGVYDMTQGDFLKGALKAFGYSEYRAKSVTGEE